MFRLFIVLLLTLSPPCFYANTSISPFYAMEYINLVGNRTLKVWITDDYIFAAKVKGLTSEGIPLNSKAQIIIAHSERNNPKAYANPEQEKIYEKVNFETISPHEFMSINSGNFVISRDRMKSISFNSKKKWGMANYPHNGRIIIKTEREKSNKKKKREFILLGAQNPQSILKKAGLRNTYFKPISLSKTINTGAEKSPSTTDTFDSRKLMDSPSYYIYTLSEKHEMHYYFKSNPINKNSMTTEKVFKKNCFLIILTLVTSLSLFGQTTNEIQSPKETDFSDRKEILKTIENFYIGDHTGSIKHKKLSMHENGAYRYINRDGEYKESTFRLDSNNSDPNYKEELISVEIYDKVALGKLRLDQFEMDEPEYKLMLLHKANGKWKITTISWGFGITP